MILCAGSIYFEAQHACNRSVKMGELLHWTLHCYGLFSPGLPAESFEARQNMLQYMLSLKGVKMAMQSPNVLFY